MGYAPIQVIKGLLKNHQVTVVNNGKEVIEILANTPFDLILMDIQMPEMDGITATKVIRDINSNVINHNIPIIATTAYAMKEDHELCLKSGMNGYLSKPINTQKLNMELKRILKLNNAVKSDYQSTPNQKFDSHAFMNSDPSFALMIMNVFIKNTYPESIAQIKHAIDNKDAEMLQAASHKLKGSVGYFSDAAEKLAFQLQEMGQKQNLSNANEVYEKLKQEIENLKTKIKPI